MPDGVPGRVEPGHASVTPAGLRADRVASFAPQAAVVRRRSRRPLVGLLLACGAAAAAFAAYDVAGRVAALRDGWTYVPVHARSTRTVGLQTATPLARISPLLVLAVVASEDRRFFQHHGFDVAEIRTALRDTWDTGRPLRGASTISQQLVKNLFLSQERSVARKLREVLYTMTMEAQLSKAEILALYLNEIEWGDGVYGATEAAAHYFHVSAEAISLDQAAVLSALIPAPRERGRGLEVGSMHRVGTFVVVRRLRRLHLLVDALGAGRGGHPLRLEDVAAVPLDGIVDAAEAGGYPTGVRRSAHRSYVAIRRALQAGRPRAMAATPQSP